MKRQSNFGDGRRFVLFAAFVAGATAIGMAQSTPAPKPVAPPGANKRIPEAEIRKHGKDLYDKRRAIKDRDQKRDIERAMAGE